MKRRLLILGAGGHGRVLADIAQRHEQYDVIGFLDDSQTGTVNGLPCLGPISRLAEIAGASQFGNLAIVIGIGINSARKQVALQLAEVVSRYQIAYARLIDPSAVVSSHASVGPGTVVMPQAVINANAWIGEHVIINTSATVDHDCNIASFARLSPGVRLAGNVSIGEGTQLGVGAVAIPGVRVGSWSLVGAGSVIVRDIPDGVKAYGVPCKVIE